MHLLEAIIIINFFQAKRSFCTKHLKTNVTDYMKDKVGVRTKHRVVVINGIFGEDGILQSKDEYEFEKKSAELMSLEGANSEQFICYFRETLKPKLALNFKNLGRSGPNSANTWTNNNAESMHHIMKMDTNWRPTKTPELINILSDLVNLQIVDLRRALYGLGNYCLQGPYRSV